MPNAVVEAFDRHAPAYERAFPSESIRSRVWNAADRLFLPGAAVLDMGCGTGEDAVHLAARGVRVTAIDISPAMIAGLKAKAAANVSSSVADMRMYRPANPVHGVLSNFGALNCVPDLDWLLELPVAPGGHLLLTLMGRFYPLETAAFLLKGCPRKAFRRFRWKSEAAVEGVRIPVYYHRLRQLRSCLEPRYELIEVRGICSLEPSPHLEHLRRFRIFRHLAAADAWLCSHRTTATLSDHYLTVWRRHES